MCQLTQTAASLHLMSCLSSLHPKVSNLSVFYAAPSLNHPVSTLISAVSILFLLDLELLNLDLFLVAGLLQFSA
jgi:hypothetical protein